MRGFIKHLKEVFIMKKLISILGILVLGLFTVLRRFLLLSIHMEECPWVTPMKMDTKEVLVEGVKVTFQIMANEEHQKMLKDMKMKEDIEPGPPTTSP